MPDRLSPLNALVSRRTLLQNVTRIISEIPPLHKLLSWKRIQVASGLCIENGAILRRQKVWAYERVMQKGKCRPLPQTGTKVRSECTTVSKETNDSKCTGCS